MKKHMKNGENRKIATAIVIVIAMLVVGVASALITYGDICDSAKTEDMNASAKLTKSSNETVVLFEDDFEDGNYYGWTTEHTSIQTDSLGNSSFMMQMHAATSDPASAYYSNSSWSNYTLESSVEIGDSYNAWSEIYIYFCGNNFVKLDTKNDTTSLGYYWYEFDGMGGIQKYVNVLDTTYLSITTLTSYRLKIDIIDKNIDVFVNDVHLFDVTSTKYSSGGIGFEAVVPYIYNSTGWFKLNIDNIKVTQNNVVAVSSSLLFEDDFEDGNLNDWTTRHAYIQNGSLGSGNFMTALHYYTNYTGYHSDFDNGSAAVTTGLNWSNYQYEVSLKIVTGRVLIAFYSPDTFLGGSPIYSLDLNPQDDKVFFPGDNYYFPGRNSTTYPLSYNIRYDIKITVFNGNMNAFIDGNLVATASGSYFTKGTVGILATSQYDGSDPDGLRCYLDNVKVTQLNSTNIPILSVNSDSANYLPGDSVTLTAAYLGLNSTNVVFKVDRPDGTAMATQSKIVPAGGSVDFSFFLPSNAQYGNYLVYASTYDGQAQTSFEVIVSVLRIISMNVPDAQANSSVDIAVTVTNGKAVTMNFILAVQVIDANGVPLSPAIAQTALVSGQTITYTQSIEVPTGSPTGEYMVQAQILTGLPSEGGYALDFMNRVMVVY